MADGKARLAEADLPQGDPTTADELQARLDSAARVVLRRVVLRRWLGGMRQAVWAASAVVAVLGAWAVMRGSVAGAGMTVVLLGVAVVASLAWAWWRRPATYAALALWDRETGRREALAAAWWYAQKADRTAAEQAHGEAASAGLEERLKALPKDLPLPDCRVLVLPWVLVAVMVVGTWRVSQAGRGPLLSEAMVAEARAQAEAVERLERAAEAMSALSAEERQALKDQVRQAAAELSASDGKSVREVMDAIEQRAREAEKLAQRLGADGEEWASPELTAALRQQADSADLGDAVADRAAERAAQEAEALAGKAGEAEGPAAERLGDVFDALGEAVQPVDQERAVGEAVARVAGADEAQKLDTAEATLRELAEQMRTLAERQQTQEELERLAQSLREAGSRVANAESQSGESAAAMTAAENGQEASPGSEGAAAEGQTAESQAQEATSPEAGQPSMAAVPSPGQPDGSQGQEGRRGQGEKGQSGPQLSLGQPDPNAGRGGQGDPGQEGPRLFAPVPGQPAGEPPDMALMVPGAAKGGVASKAPGSGLPPGKGSPKDLTGEPTELAETAKKARVTARQSGEGSSTVRQIEGGAPREEGVTRAASQLSVEFLETQEAALDEAALPAGRREQVRRYFNALRKRLEPGSEK